MGRIIVDVMPKPELLDPQGKAVAGALPRLGFEQFTAVRQGKRFELEIDDSVDDSALAEIAESLLANTVIEDFTVTRVPASNRVDDSRATASRYPRVRVFPNSASTSTTPAMA